MNSIVAGNYADTRPNIAGTLTSDGYNLFQDVPEATFAVNPRHPTDISLDPRADLKIDSALSGKLIQVHLPLSGSPAIDRIPLSACLINGVSTDERGVKRPDGQKQLCDIGAVEY